MIKSITIEIGNREVVLTLDEAKKLFKDLGVIFETRERIIERMIPSYPVQIPSPIPWKPYGPVWCGSGADSSLKIDKYAAFLAAKTSTDTQS